MSSNVDAHLEIFPESTIEFILSESEATPKVTMTLRHPDPDSSPVAFKVKTTQPRRYLVRPNQGLIKPGGSEEVQILLVEKDKTSLLQSFQRLGQTALDHSKDKFLVQSVAVDASRAAQLADYDQLTSLWSSVTSQGSNAAVANKKLHVKHTVDAATASLSGSPARGEKGGQGVSEEPSAMNKEQLVSELSGLRRKYDELVSFSVNLTAERDILNNTLEQTKRDLSRQIAKSAATDNSGGSKTQAAPKKGGGNPLVHIVLYLMFFFVGAHLHKMGVLDSLPVFGGSSVADAPPDDPSAPEAEVHREEL